jgi:D-alanine--poly(phosphoribitol) ligase subunit 1
MRILDIIDDWGRKTPARVAYVSGSRQLTYGELCRRSDNLAAHLARALPADRSPIAVIGHKEPELLIAFLGAVKAGHPYVPIESAVPAQRVERVVTAAGCSMRLTHESVAALAERNGPKPEMPLGPADPYYIMFTSGSTGEPKGVVITLGCVASFLAWMLAEHSFQPGETFLNQVSYSFDVSVMDTYVSLLTGGTVVSIGKDEVSNPKQLYQSLRAAKVTNWVSTPSFAGMCLAERDFAAAMLPELRRFLFCGETLPPEVAAQCLERFPRAEVWNTYGPTETTVATTSIRIDREILARYPRLPIGHPMPGTRVVVVDDGGRLLQAGEPGEIVIAGPNVSPGYVGRSDLTAQAFFELDGMRAYRTGDRGYHQDGLLFCDGRIDNQIKLHGHRVELGDVEANLRSIEGIRDAVVLPILRNDRPDSLAAFVILSERPPGSDFEVTQVLRSRLAHRLPAYMLPRKFVLVDRFPLTANGKADRRRLAALLT